MTLIIEDGSGVSNANSYITSDEMRDYADMRGTALGSDDSTLEPYIIQAMDLVESHRSRFQGQKTSTTQSLQWPRSGVFIDGAEIESTVIPIELKNAVAQAALDAMNGDLMPTVAVSENSGSVASETVGSISVSYHASEKRTAPKLQKFNAWMSQLLNNNGLYAVSVRT